MYRAIARNKRNTVFIFFVFFLIIGGLGYVANLFYSPPGNYSILVVVLIGAIGFALVQYFIAGGEAVAMAGAVEVTQAEAPRLWRVVENLSIATGTPMPKVYVVQDPAPNAFATGRDPEHAIVAATTGLLDIMSDTELEGVMAHELGHVRNYDIRVSFVVYGLVVAVGILSDLLIRMAFWGGVSGRGRDREGGGNNPAVLVIGIIAIVIAPVVATLVQLAISRQREYLADATGALTTRYPEGLASALEKLETQGRPLQRQNSSMAHLWIANPLKPGLFAGLFSTHPPLEERVARLRSMSEKF